MMVTLLRTLDIDSNDRAKATTDTHQPKTAHHMTIFAQLSMKVRGPAAQLTNV